MIGSGGCLQWQDLDWRDIAPYPPYTDFDSVKGTFNQHMKAYGLSQWYEAIH